MSAAKQCLRCYFPMDCQPTKLLAWLDKLDYRQCFAGMMGTSKQLSDYQFDNKIPISVLIGPEGDFSPSEREFILSLSQVVPFTISKNILRSDTAVISAISLVNFINNLP